MIELALTLIGGYLAVVAIGFLIVIIGMVGYAMLASVATGVHMYPRPPSKTARSIAALAARGGTALAGLWPQRPALQALRRTRG